MILNGTTSRNKKPTNKNKMEKTMKKTHTQKPKKKKFYIIVSVL